MNKIVLFFSIISVFNVFYAAERSAIKDEALNALLGKLAQGSSSDDENEPDASFISLEEAKKMVSQKYPKVLFCEEFFSSPDFSVFVRTFFNKKLKESYSSKPTAYEKRFMPKEFLKSQYYPKSKE